jgi:hypothetical protein
LRPVSAYKLTSILRADFERAAAAADTLKSRPFHASGEVWNPGGKTPQSRRRRRILEERGQNESHN